MTRPLALLLLCAAVLAGFEQVVAVNDYLDLDYRDEPVSFEVDLPAPLPAQAIGLREDLPWQVEVLTGSSTAATRVRLWTRLDLAGDSGPGAVAGQPRHRLLTIHDQAAASSAAPVVRETAADPVAGLATVVLTSDRLRARVLVGSATFDPPLPARQLPGPVLALGRPDGPLLGGSRLQVRSGVRSVRTRVVNGPVFWQATCDWRFADGGTWRSSVRLFAGKPYLNLVEDCAVGGDGRWLFTFDGLLADAFFRPRDRQLADWAALDLANPCGDYTTIPGQECLARLCVWSQFNYFAGKQETIALKSPDPSAPLGEPLVVTRAGASYATRVATPPGDGTAIGAFTRRPDRWTRAKVNHVDLYLRPEVPGRPETRGAVGLAGAVLVPAMEAWLVDGHREWALFATRAGDDRFLALAHLREGAWPLDRLNRLQVVWGPGGAPLPPEKTAPDPEPVAGLAGAALRMPEEGKRGGLQSLNVTTWYLPIGRLKKAPEPAAKALVDYAGTPPTTRADMVEAALGLALATDASAYPGRASLLPWSHPDALNPFYQGMENMGFYHGLVDAAIKLTDRALRMGLAKPQPILEFARHAVDRSLDVYVSPRSGCWWNSHVYATMQMKRLARMGRVLTAWGLFDLANDQRFARLGHFFTRVLTPIDADEGQRLVPPIGDHGLSRERISERLAEPLAAAATTSEPEVFRLAGEMAWFVAEDGGAPPAGIAPTPPSTRGEWLQGYGATLRATDLTHRRVEIRAPGAIQYANDFHELRLRVALEGAGRVGALRTVNVLGLEGVEAQLVSCRVTRDQMLARIELRVPDQTQWRRKQRGKPTPTMVWYTSTVGLGVPLDGLTVGEATVIDGTLVRSVPATAHHQSAETLAVLRAGATWGHHHADKGSLWFWARDVAFLGDCSWGAPPGGAYWNPFKQGPESGTQLEFHGINNWTLPCRFPAPWISDSAYREDIDYARATCLYPYNPDLDLTRSTPVALTQGYERQVLLLHPETLVVRDSVEANVQVTWRAHAFPQATTTASGAAATIASPHGPVAELRIVHPSGLELATAGVFPERLRSDGSRHPGSGQPFTSLMLTTPLPASASATWVVDVRGADASAAVVERLDTAGRVTRIQRSDGRTWIVFLASEPFRWQGLGIDWHGSVGVAERTGERATALTVIRGP